MRSSNAAIATTDDSRGVDWSAPWDTPTATKLFALIRHQVCELPPIQTEPTADMVVEALAEARTILAEVRGDGTADDGGAFEYHDEPDPTCWA
jgi:hypothetical protein